MANGYYRNELLHSFSTGCITFKRAELISVLQIQSRPRRRSFFHRVEYFAIGVREHSIHSIYAVISRTLRGDRR